MHKRDDIQFDEKRNPTRLNGYSIDPPILLSAAQVQQIQYLFKMPSSYTFSHEAKACPADYQILFAFHSDQKIVRIALGLQSDEFAVFDDEDNDIESVNTERYFDLIHAQIVSIAKSIFPKDPKIQNLQEKRH